MRGGEALKLKRLIMTLPLVMAGCLQTNPDGTRGEPGGYDWFLSASDEQRDAYYAERCRTRDGVTPGTPQMEQCIGESITRAAQIYYQVALDIAALSRPAPTINVNVDPGPVTCRQLGSFITCD